MSSGDAKIEANSAKMMKFFIAGFEKGFALSGTRATHDTDETPDDYALEVKRNLGIGYYTITSGEGLSFLTEAERDAARACIAEDKPERHLVAFMTPILRDRLLSTMPRGYVLVNCEECGWTPQRAGVNANYHAPDHFIAPHYLVEFRPPYKNAPPREGGEYGTFPVINARRSLVAVGAAMKSLDLRGEGDFMRYLEALSCPDSNDRIATIRGFVYDWEKCILMTACSGIIINVTNVQWTAPGSLAFIRNYFNISDYKKHFHEGLQLACDSLGVTLPLYSSAPHNCGQCVLGAGAFGTVFEVLRGEQRLALKLVLYEEGCEELDGEFELARRLPADALRSVISVVNNSLWRGSLDRGAILGPIKVAAFLLSTVGIPFSHVDDVTDEYGPLILESLSDLHAAGVCHGDARYTNVVRLEHEGPPKRVELRWIDLRTRGVTTSVKCMDDITMFFKSIGRSYEKGAVSGFAIATFERTWRNAEERRGAALELWNYHP
jgi:hypothetical protein